ncbi:MAG: glycosyltransferase [Alteromonadaceae bacterium]|nr:glycosyltransferase [Alteromonadaceae bacterium]
MRVLHFYRTYLPESYGGVEEAIRQTCLATSRQGVENRVLTLARVRSVQTLERPEASVIQAPLQWDPASCSMGLSLFRLYVEHARWADVVHVHYPWPFADLVHVLSRVRRPVVMTYHSDIVRQSSLERLYAPLRRLFFRQLDVVVATSPNYLESSAFLQHYRDKTTAIPLGLSPESYASPSDASRQYVMERFGAGFFLFVGVLRYYKGLDTLLEAARETGLPVVIAGTGPEHERLWQRSQAMGLDNVLFAGFVSDEIKAALFEAARAVVFPSSLRSEAFGVTLLEGLMHGKPLISCEIGTGTSYVNQHGETGLVLPPADTPALAHAMQTLAADDDMAADMGSKGRERLQRLFSGDAVGSAYMALYRKLEAGGS